MKAISLEFENEPFSYLFFPPLADICGKLF